jgi:tetratricopeptide (TPR) repeat protein
VNANAKHLLRSWGVAVFFGGLCIFGLIAGLVRGDYKPVAFLSVGFCVVALNIYLARRRAIRLFQEPTVDRAIAYYHNSARRVPNGKAMAAYLSGFAAVLYGQFDRARDELASVNWTSLPPLYQGFEAYVHSLLAIFERGDYTRALLLAKEALDFCTVSEAFPGSKTSRAALDANVAVCELLAGRSDSALLDRLDRAVKELPGVSPAIPAWALATYNKKLGHDTAAAEYMAVVQRLVPHSSCLNG